MLGYDKTSLLNRTNASSLHLVTMASCRAARRAFGVRLYQTSQGTRRPRQAHCARARADKDEAPDQLSMSCPVPRDQQPMFEMKQLQQDTLFTWAELPLPDFVLRLAAVYLGRYLQCPAS